MAEEASIVPEVAVEESAPAAEVRTICKLDENDTYACFQPEVEEIETAPIPVLPEVVERPKSPSSLFTFLSRMVWASRLAPQTLDANLASIGGNARVLCCFWTVWMSSGFATTYIFWPGRDIVKIGEPDCWLAYGQSSKARHIDGRKEGVPKIDIVVELTSR